MADEDKVRHQKDMANYEPPITNNSTKRKKRKAKDPNQPKRPWSSFFFFCDEFRTTVKTENPDFKVSDVAKELGKMWAECKDKSKYEDLNIKAKERYNVELERYKFDGPASKKSKLIDENDENVDAEDGNVSGAEQSD